jgi:hypothetical protein
MRFLTLLPVLFLLLISLNNAQNTTTLDISTGNFFACGIRTDETLQCWGENDDGQSTVPNDLGTVKAVNAGGDHACAIKSDDTLRCWGRNNEDQTTPPVNLGMVKAVNAGDYHTCAIQMNNVLRCWGSNNDGQSTIPFNLGGVKVVSTQFAHTCAVRSDDILECWGRNTDGQSTNPPNLGTVKFVTTGAYHTCAIRTDDMVRCWGGTDSTHTTVPNDLGTVKALSTGAQHSCAIKSDDSLQCWGDNNYGQSDVPDDLGKVKKVSAGGYFTCVVKIDDTVYCWGDNTDEQTTLPEPTISLEAPTLVLEEGTTSTVRLNASHFPWKNVVINMDYSGTATRNSDYMVDSAEVITPLENSVNLTISVLADNENEDGESLVIEIGSVTGATENGIQQITLVILDNEATTPASTTTLESPTNTPESTLAQTPTATLESPDDNLLVNSSFENALTSWTVKAGVGDKVKCNKDGKPHVARTGTCAFQFKSGVGEATKLDQTIASSAQTWAVGDTLSLSVYVKAMNSAANGKIKGRIKYSDGTTTGKLDATIAQNSDYMELVDSYTLESANVSKIKLSVQNRSVAGKMLVDDVALLYTVVGEAGLLPLP